MLFCSERFLLFFLVVFVAYWAISAARFRVWLLLGASIFFYASWNEWLTGLVCFSALADYLIGRGLDASRSQSVRRLLLGVSLAGNLSVLGYLKYANFFLDSLRDTLQMLGAEPSLPILSVILPLGISFYTFEAISYTVDVYQRRIPAERRLENFLLFILFFPHLIAGPIVRARDFLPQVERRKHWQWSRLNLGARFFLLGMFKKMAIADSMAALADPIFAAPEQFHTGALWMAAIAWVIQVYCDFSGYSDMAVGLAHMLGYKLVQNFNMPYLATSVAEFWRRWHISLSSWLRDYVYIPLGGSRGTPWQTKRNLLITMTLAGLWHGANWSYVIFGVLQGLLLIGHRSFQQYCQRRAPLSNFLQTLPGTALRIGITFATISVTLVIFRAPTLAAAGTMLTGMFSPQDGLSAQHLGMFAACAALMALCHLLAPWQDWKKMFAALPSPVRGVGYAIALSSALLLSPFVSKAFIYFQF
jgi:alginate O-acetyltransferase complex protein AlgI